MRRPTGEAELRSPVGRGDVPCLGSGCDSHCALSCPRPRAYGFSRSPRLRGGAGDLPYGLSFWKMWKNVICGEKLHNPLERDVCGKDVWSSLVSG